MPSVHMDVHILSNGLHLLSKMDNRFCKQTEDTDY